MKQSKFNPPTWPRPFKYTTGKLQWLGWGWMGGNGYCRDHSQLPSLEKSLQRSGHDSCSLFRRWHCNFDTPFKKEKPNQQDTNFFHFNKVVRVGQCKYLWQSFHAALYFPLHVIKSHGILRKRIHSPRTVQIAKHRELSICFILILQCQELQQYKKEKKIHNSC